MSSLLLSREKGGMRTSKWEPSVLSMRKVPLNTNTGELSAAGAAQQAALKVRGSNAPHVSTRGL